jgi:hypothetical protein
MHNERMNEWSYLSSRLSACFNSRTAGRIWIKFRMCIIAMYVTFPTVSNNSVVDKQNLIWKRDWRHSCNAVTMTTNTNDAVPVPVPVGVKVNTAKNLKCKV